MVPSRDCGRRVGRGVADLRPALRSRLEVGKVAVRQGPITSAPTPIEITLYSPGGHTSRPHFLTAGPAHGSARWSPGCPGKGRRIDPRNSTVLVGRGQRGYGRQRHSANRSSCPALFARPAGRPGLTLRSLSAKPFLWRCYYQVGDRAHVQRNTVGCRWSTRKSSTRILAHAIGGWPRCAGLADTSAVHGGEDSPGIWRRFCGDGSDLGVVR